MSLERLLNTNTVTIVTPGTATSRYRHQVNNFASPTDETVTKGWLTQVNTTEQIGARSVVTTGWMLFLRPTETIAASYKVEVDGVPYEVDGDPHLAQTPRGPHHIECVLRKVSELKPG